MKLHTLLFFILTQWYLKVTSLPTLYYKDNLTFKPTYNVLRSQPKIDLTTCTLIFDSPTIAFQQNI